MDIFHWIFKTFNWQNVSKYHDARVTGQKRKHALRSLFSEGRKDSGKLFCTGAISGPKTGRHNPPPVSIRGNINRRHRRIRGVSLRPVLRAGFAEITDVKEQEEEEDAFKPGVLSSGVLDSISDVAVQLQNLKKIRGVSILR